MPTTKKTSAKKTPTKAQLELKILENRVEVGNHLTAQLSSTFGGRSNRLRKNYNRKLGGGDRVLHLDREYFRDTARNLDITSDITTGFHDRIVDAVVGCGLRPIPRNDNARPLVPRFMKWLNTADHRRVLSGCELQRLTFRGQVVDGDILSIKTNQRTIQTAESDQVDSLGQTETLIDGVHYDETGRVTGYQVHPYSRFGVLPPASKNGGTKVNADNAMLLARRTRASMTRGLPFLAAALERLADIDETAEANIVANKLAASLAFIATGKSPGAFANAMTDSTQTGTSRNGQDQTASLTNMDPGTMLYAPEGYEVKGFQGAAPGSQFEPFIFILLRAAATALGFPLEYLMRDNSKANFSVSRMVRLQTEEAAKPHRQNFISSWLEPLWEWWVMWEATEGTLGIPVEEALPTDWSTPPLLMLDPQKETQAAVLAVENNFKTKDEVVREAGRELDAIYKQREREVSTEAEMGITPAKLPGSPEGSGQNDPDENTDPAPKD